jgi:hypothetical protein
MDGCDLRRMDGSDANEHCFEMMIGHGVNVFNQILSVRHFNLHFRIWILILEHGGGGLKRWLWDKKNY